MGRRYIPPEAKEQAARYAAKTSTYQAEEKFGITRTTIRKVMVSLGLKRRRAGNLDTYRPSERRRAVRMRLMGIPLSEISHQTKIPAWYVAQLTSMHRKKIKETNLCTS